MSVGKKIGGDCQYLYHGSNEVILKSGFTCRIGRSLTLPGPHDTVTSTLSYLTMVAVERGVKVLRLGLSEELLAC